MFLALQLDVNYWAREPIELTLSGLLGYSDRLAPLRYFVKRG